MCTSIQPVTVVDVRRAHRRARVEVTSSAVGDRVCDCKDAPTAPDRSMFFTDIIKVNVDFVCRRRDSYLSVRHDKSRKKNGSFGPSSLARSNRK